VETPRAFTQQQALKRLHVLAGDGRVVSGAAAFVEIWTRLPKWRWAARIKSVPGGLAALELSYQIFLPLRPFVSRCFGRLMRRRAVPGGVGRR